MAARRPQGRVGAAVVDGAAVGHEEAKTPLRLVGPAATVAV